MGTESKDTTQVVSTEVLVPPETHREDKPRGSLKGIPKWRRTLLANLLLALVIFVANLGLFAWAWTRPNREGGLATVFTGSCSDMSKVSTGAHLAINILSTLLLAASNFTVQCLIAPTRKSLDSEHSKRRWLDVGITSFRNFKASSGWHKTIIVLLFASSIPLHLVYNSIIIATPAVNEYMALLVAKDFLTGGAWRDINPEYMYNSMTALNYDTVQYLQDHTDQLVQLSNDQCKQTYSKELMNEWSNVLLVTDVSQSNHTVIEAWEFRSKPSGWHGQVDWDYDGQLYKALQIDNEAITTPGVWGTIEPTCNGTAGKDLEFNCGGVSGTVAANITHCLAQQFQPPCSIRLTASSLVVVLICNAIKVGCVLAALFLFNQQPILTVGDAVSSCLKHSDHTGFVTGPVSVQDVQKKLKRRVAPGTHQNDDQLALDPWRQRRSLWFKGASISRWATTMVLLMIVWAICLALLFSPGVTWAAGLGTLDLKALITGMTGRSLTANIILANIPQLVLSILYVFYNGIMTSMLVTAEFCRFARHKKGLRVSSKPVGAQRSTYWLQLPLRYSVPLMALMAVLHWLVSRSIFTISLAMYGNDGKRAPADDITACGYSTYALVGSLACGAALVLALPMLGFLKLTPGAPIARSCSLAIQAAAFSGHPEDADRQLMYGVLDCEPTGGIIEESNGKRVGFGTNVLPLVDGEMYC